LASSFPKVWNLIGEFKERCGKKGWKAYPYDDLIETENEYHRFLWLHNLRPHTFRKVVMNPRCSIREGLSYRTVGLTYMAWVLPEALSESIWRIVKERAGLSRRVALYDLSSAYGGNTTCLGLNETKSVVLQEFECFLDGEYGIKLTSTRPARKG